MTDNAERAPADPERGPAAAAPKPGMMVTGHDEIIRYLREQGMTETDITKYMAAARDSGADGTAFSFGSDEVVVKPLYRLTFADGEYRLMADHD